MKKTTKGVKEEMFTLVTGACGGLGQAFCRILAQRGTPLFLTGRSETRLLALKEELSRLKEGIRIEIFPCDLRSAESREALFRHLGEANIRFSRLIYAAGVDTQMPFEQFDEGRILTQTRVNFEGAVSLMRAFLKWAELDGTCEILAVGSVTGLFPTPNFALYSATKRALEQFCAALREELRGRAKVTCVLPGSILTREDVIAYVNAHGKLARRAAVTPERAAEISLAAVKRNKRRKVFGTRTRIYNALARLLPYPIRSRLYANIWKGTKKDFYGEKKNPPKGGEEE